MKLDVNSIIFMLFVGDRFLCVRGVYTIFGFCSSYTLVFRGRRLCVGVFRFVVDIEYLVGFVFVGCIRRVGGVSVFGLV